MRRNTRAIPCLLLFFTLPSGRVGAQLSPRPPRVEITTPKSPAPVLADGKRVLVYELHVTNFGRGALGFREIDVLNGAGGAPPLASYRDTALKDVLQPVGGAQGIDPRRLDPGQRTVVFLWLALPFGTPMPRMLRHRLVFDNLDTADVRRDGGTQSAIDGAVVPVSRQSAPVLRTPFDSGDWLVGDGPSNTSAHRRSLNAVDAGAHIGQRFAIDWVKIGPNGNTYHDDEHLNENYWAFAQPVHSVAGGEVVAVVDSIPDHAPHGPVPPVTLANIAGNYVTVRIGSDRYATYAHLKRGSIRVHTGQRVASGEVIALLGNTGQSTGPHLHFQITDGKSFLGSEGVPFVFDRFRFLGYGNDFEENKHPDSPRRREMPVDGEVVGLP
jgi:murein DD-endopeptidase